MQIAYGIGISNSLGAHCHTVMVLFHICVTLVNVIMTTFNLIVISLIMFIGIGPLYTIAQFSIALTCVIPTFASHWWDARELSQC